MIFASCRKDFTGTEAPAPLVLRRDLFNSTENISLFSLFHGDLRQRRFLILVHGFNNSFSAALGAYVTIDARLDTVTPAYDQVIGFFWPGEDHAIEFYKAGINTNTASTELKQLLQTLESAGAVVDIQTHSLGGRVALQAINTGIHCRNLILTAPAVNSNALVPGEWFGTIPARCSRTVVAFSEHDPVLRLAYTLAEQHRALGLVGPVGHYPKIEPLDLSSVISTHGGYRVCPEFYKAWQGWVA